MNQRQRTDYIVVHCADTPPSRDIGADEIRRWHVEERGWRDIGYHAVIRRDGTLEFGRDIYEVGAHVKGHNSNSVGVCLVGGKAAEGGPEDNFTDEQFATLDKVLQLFKAIFKTAEIVGHRDLARGRDCPCFDVKKFTEGKHYV